MHPAVAPAKFPTLPTVAPMAVVTVMAPIVPLLPIIIVPVDLVVGPVQASFFAEDLLGLFAGETHLAPVDLHHPAGDYGIRVAHDPAPQGENAALNLGSGQQPYLTAQNRDPPGDLARHRQVTTHQAQ